MNASDLLGRTTRERERERERGDRQADRQTVGHVLSTPSYLRAPYREALIPKMCVDLL